MLELIEEWAAIPSPTYDLVGLGKMLEALQKAFAVLGGEMRTIDLDPHVFLNLDGEEERREVGKALAIQKRPEAPVQVFLGGHYDTVYQKPFPVRREGDHLYGPGVTDMKGGIAVMLAALMAVDDERLGWEVLLTPDEEVGSPSSQKLFPEIAKCNQIGLIFESSDVEGHLIKSRPSSTTYTLVVRGEAGHVKDQGKSAIVALSDLVMRLKGVNVGEIKGGKAPNVIPDLAVCRVNSRNGELDRDAIADVEKKWDVTIEVHESSHRPEKPLDERMEQLLPGKWIESMGVCDGNNLASFGLLTIDSLGVRGGKIHSPEEFMVISSLKERVEMTANLLRRLIDES